MSLSDDCLIIAWAICVYLFIPWLAISLSLVSVETMGLVAVGTLNINASNIKAWEMLGVFLIVGIVGITLVGVVYD